MAGVRVEIDDTAILDALNQLLDKSSDLSPFFYEFGNFIGSELAEQFQKSTDAYGFPWIPSNRAMEEADGKTLVDRGHLHDSFHPFVTMEGQSMVFGSDSDYAAIHQFGGETGSKNGRFTMEARSMLPDNGWPSIWEEEVMTLLQLHLSK